VGGRELADTGKDRPRLRHIAIGEEVLDGSGVKPIEQPRHRGKRPELGAEDEAPVRSRRVIEWLLSQPVAPQQKPALPSVPEGEGEHPGEPPEAADAPALPGVDHRLGIALGPEHMPKRCEFVAQGAEIVDLAVAEERHRAVLAEHRLIAAGEIDDGKPAEPETDAGFDVEALAVRAAMGDRVGHAAQEVPRNRREPRPTLSLRVAEDPCQTAHSLSLAHPASHEAPLNRFHDEKRAALRSH
jgi:hypothetical protein